MKAFAQLFTDVDATNKTSRKLEALTRYFATVPAADGAWAVFFLSGRTVKRVLPTARLRDWGAEAAGIPGWLFEESYQAVGDLAEAVSLLLPRNDTGTERPLHEWVEENLLPLQSAAEPEQKRLLLEAWRSMSQPQRLVWNKIITGGFRVGVSQRMVVLALAKAAQLEAATIAHRLMGEWRPTPAFFTGLLHPEVLSARNSQPYPFFLACPLEADPATLGPFTDWQAEWKWDGIRSQLVRRDGQLYLWSRGEELVTERYPEIIAEAARLKDGTVLDGEILAWKNGRVLPFSELQRRIGRKTVGKRLLQDVPASFLAFDLLEQGGQDLRSVPLADRRARLEALALRDGAALQLGPLVGAASWDELARRRLESRERGVEGVMLKLRVPLWRGPGTWSLVEVENSSLSRRCGDDLCPARSWAPCQSLHRLYLRGLGQRGAGPVRQGLFGAERRGDSRGRSFRTRAHAGEVRPGPAREPRSRLRARLRGDTALDQAQVRRGRALSAHGPLAQRQKA